MGERGRDRWREKERVTDGEIEGQTERKREEVGADMYYLLVNVLFSLHV